MRQIFLPEQFYREESTPLLAYANDVPVVLYLNGEHSCFISAEKPGKKQPVNAGNSDIIVMAAAVADYTPAEYSEQKIKKSEGDNTLVLKRTKDILAGVGNSKKDGQVVVGFSMETENLIENSRSKLTRKNADIICANNLRVEGAGFGVDTNVMTLITANDCVELPLMSKEAVALAILDKAVELAKTV